MVDEVCSDLFCIKVPLPDSPLKYLNSYIVRTPDRNLIIDTGFDHQSCFDVMHDGLNKLGINLDHTDFFITHFHADHFSLLSKLKTPASRVYFNRPEAELLGNWEGFGTMFQDADRHGFPKDKLQVSLAAHPGSKFNVEWVPEVSILSEGQTLKYGDYTFSCIETPGHTPGHICMYEAAKKILISGDHVLIDISPNIQCWNNDKNPLKKYLKSLRKVRKLDVGLILPGHRRSFTDLPSRVDELISHHEKRLDEICDILGDTPLSAYSIASKMDWDIKAFSWKDFTIDQKWFATGEVLSHLRYLEKKKKIHRSPGEKRIRFSRVEN